MSMCKISIDTVRRANSRTMMQVGQKGVGEISRSPLSGFDVSVSVMGKTYGKRLSAAQIRSSFDKALSNAEKV